MLPEPVSPELVLIDFELAERERRRLCEKARLAEFMEQEKERLRFEARDVAVVDVAALRRAVEQDGSWSDDDEPSVVRRDLRAFARRKLLPAALMGSLLVNGILAAEVVVHVDSRQAALQVPVAEHPTAIESVSPAGATSVLPRRSVVERKLISLIIAAPTRKLPRAFVDPATGLVRNNVRVVCRRAQAGSYMCVVRLPAGSPSGRLVVRYRPGRGGKGVFTWYAYRRGEGKTRFLQNR